MAGTSEGAKKSAARLLMKNPNYFKDLGRKGGINGSTGGFASTGIGADGLTGPQRASKVGVIGGRISRRKKA